MSPVETATTINTAAMVEDSICRSVRHILGLRVDNVTPQMRLVDDLHCASLDLIEIPMAIEDRFGIAITDDEVEQCATVGCYVRLTCTKLAIAFQPAAEGASS